MCRAQGEVGLIPGFYPEGIIRSTGDVVGSLSLQHLLRWLWRATKLVMLGDMTTCGGGHVIRVHFQDGR